MRALWRDWVLADFRDFRFTWPGFWRWTGISLAALLIACIITLYFLDWNEMRAPISRYASHHFGRTVRIDGDLDVKLFRRQPHISIGGLFVGNPDWESRQQGLRIAQADIEFRLWPALFGNIVLPLVSLDRPEVLVVRREDGRTNWDSGSDTSTGWKLPPIQRFLVKDGRLDVEDAVRHLKFLGSISSQEEAGGKGAAFQLKGDGTLNDNKFTADVHGGPLINVDPSKPYQFNADVAAGPTHVVVGGQVTHPFQLGQFEARISATGKTLSELYYLTGVALPGTAPYQLKGALKRDGGIYSLTDLSGAIGASDMHGYLTVDVSGKIPELKGHLSSRSLSLDDLGPILRGGKSVAETGSYLLPDVTLHTERLRQVNGEVDYDAEAIKSRDFPLRGLSAHISIQDGVLRLKPLAFAFVAGKLSGSLAIDARKAVPLTDVDARITDIHIEHFIKGAEKPLSGIVEARAKLSGSGSSVHQVAASANGMVTAVMPHGQMRKSLAEWMGVNALSALGLNLSGDQSRTDLRCAVLSFNARNGVLGAQRMVLDTDPTRVDGNGSINLKDETMDLTMKGQPKHFELLHIRAPITVSGRLGAPSIGVDAKPAVMQGVIGAGLGLLSPLASLFAFIDPGLGDDANCAGILADARGQGAPVKSSAIRGAKAAQPSR
ncbi:MAG TPA: AsmA family protein [Rhizomicrobium sp.]